MPRGPATVWGLRPSPQRPPTPLLGRKPWAPEGAALPWVPCPCPSGRRSTLASLAQTLPGDGRGVCTPGSGPSGSGTAVPDAPTLSLQLQVNALVKPQGRADKRWGDPGVSQALLQILVILSLQLLLRRKSS